jgi:hypothetical protein
MSLCGDAPDTSGVNDAARANADIAREALAWYKQVYAEQAPDRARAADTATKTADAQTEAMRFATEQARDLDAYNKETFRPLEKRFVEDASTFDTEARRKAAAESAAADVDMSAAAARAGNDRALARAGIAPGSMKALALAEDSAVGQSAARGGAMTKAVKDVEQQGYARMADAVGLGRGLAPTQATQQQIATSAGSQGVGSAMQGLQAATSGNAVMGQGFNTAMNANSAAGNLFGQAARLDAEANQGALGSITSIAQTAGQLGWKPFSDENMKKNTGKEADGKEAVAAIEATPVHDGWQYDPAKGGPDEAGMSRIGPMAQDVKRTMGEGAAPGGKVLDLVNMNGTMMAAVKQLARDVKQLKAAVQLEAA